MTNNVTLLSDDHPVLTVRLLAWVIWAVFAALHVWIRLEYRVLSELATLLVEELEVLAHLAALHDEARQLVLIQIPELAGNLLDFWIPDQCAKCVELELYGMLYFIAESPTGLVVNHDNMRWAKEANCVAFKPEPSFSPTRHTPVTVKAPFFFANNTPFVGMLLECDEVVFEVSEGRSEITFPCDIVFCLLVNLGTAIRSGLRLIVWNLVSPLKCGAIWALVVDVNTAD